MEMNTNQPVDTSDCKEPKGMEIETQDQPSMLSILNKDNLNDQSANSIDMDQPNISKDITEQCLQSPSKLEICNTNENNTVSMDQFHANTGKLIELSDLGISERNSNINELEIEHFETNNEVEMLNQSFTIDNSKVICETDANNEMEQQNMSIDSLKQSILYQPDATKNYNLLTSPEKVDQSGNSAENFFQHTNIDKKDQPNNITEKMDQTTSENIIQPNTTTEDLNQASNHPENIAQLNITTEKLDQTAPENRIQPSTSLVKLDPPNIYTGNKDELITPSGNMDQPNTNDSVQEIVQPNVITESIDQVNTRNVTIETMDQTCNIPEDLNQPSTSAGNLIRSGCTTSQMLQKLSPSIEDKNQENSLNENDSGSQIEEEKVQLFTDDKGPHWHNVVNNLVTLPVIATNLPKVFKNFPIFGKPENRASLQAFYDKQIKDFVGCDLNDAEYNELKDYCSIDNLRTGKEFTMNSKIPHVGIPMRVVPDQMPGTGDKPDLFVLRKLKARVQKDPRNLYAKKLKYRGVRLIPMSSQEEQLGIPDTKPPDMEPGKDVLYRIRVYRPFMFSSPRVKAQIRGRHSVFSCDLVVCGRQPLTAVRDRLVCRNDADLRLDVSLRPHDRATATAKDMFPSGFLFINNVFYVDGRAGCQDTSAVIRTWAVQRGIGKFPVMDMAAVNMQDVNVRLAHPEVYVHQGNCEHVFLVSEIRLLNYSDPLHLSCYPCHTAVSHNQTIYCTTCAEFGAKWIVTGCDRVPFDPAFFCDICFKQYLYKDGKKIGDFKAYAYKGNELSMLKPQS